MIWLSALGWLRSALRAVLSLVVKYPLQVALCASLLACGYLWRGWSHERADYAAYRAASAQAAKDQAFVNHVPAVKSQAIAEKSNAEAPAYYRAVHAAADAHAVRVRDPRIAGPASVPGADPVVPSVHGPALDPGQPTADLVCRPAVEDHWLVRTAGRAAEMRQQALDLITSGAAIKDDSDDPR